MRQKQATTAGIAQGPDTGGLPRIECDLYFIDGFRRSEKEGKLRKKRPLLPVWPVQLPIDIGDWGLVTSGRSILDRDGLQEVYLEGDMIIVDEYDLDGSLEIVQLRVFPGVVRASFNQELPGLSCDPDETASVELSFNIKLTDPRRFYSSIRTIVPDPHDPQANVVLKDKFCETITAKLVEVFAANIALWSHPDVREVSGQIARELERLLEYYGLQVSDMFASRRLPPSLPDLVVEYRIAEQRLLAEIMANPTIPNPIGLNADQISDIRTTSTRRGDGAGLFVLSTDTRVIVDCLTWLEILQPLPAAAICFLKLLKDGKVSPRELELTKKIVLSSFRNPILGIGEWANPEKDVESAEIFQINSRMTAIGAAVQGGPITAAGPVP